MHPLVPAVAIVLVTTLLSAYRPVSDSPSETAAPASMTWTLADAKPPANVPTEVLGAPAQVEIDGIRGLRFNGVDDALLLQTNPVVGMEAFTIEMLVRPEAGGPFEQRFLHISATDDHRMLFELRMLPDGRWYLDTFLRAVNGAIALIDAEKLHAPDRWTWVAMTYSDGRVEHFVDGTSEKSGAVDFPPMAGGATSIGMRMNRVSWYHGAIAELRFHPGVLKADALQRRR